MLSRLGRVISATDYLDLTDQASIVSTMADKAQSQSFQHDETQNQQTDDLVRQDYHVRVSGGQKFIVPNALEDVELPLAKTYKPDYSMAVDMPGGVSVFLLEPLF